MKTVKNHFERNWLLLFLFLYMLIMLPLPWYFSTEYIPGLWGVPLFVFGWIIHGLVVLLCTAIYAHQCMQRPEYKNFHESEYQE